MLAFIAVTALVQVFYRYVLNSSLGWSEELTRIGFIWMTFIGSAVVINRRRHLKIDVFVSLLSERKQIILDIIVHVLTLAFMVFLTIQGYDLAQRAARTLTGALRWPRSVIFLPVVFGALFSVLFCIRLLIQDVFALKEGREASEERI